MFHNGIAIVTVRFVVLLRRTRPTKIPQRRHSLPRLSHVDMEATVERWRRLHHSVHCRETRARHEQLVAMLHHSVIIQHCLTYYHTMYCFVRNLIYCTVSHYTLYSCSALLRQDFDKCTISHVLICLVLLVLNRRVVN